MPRYRRVLRQPAAIADLRQAGDVTIEPASPPPNDEPQLTDADIAPEASPAATAGTTTTRKRTRKPRAKKS